jgi:hypothetical protein
VQNHLLSMDGPNDKVIVCPKQNNSPNEPNNWPR